MNIQALIAKCEKIEFDGNYAPDMRIVVQAMQAARFAEGNVSVPVNSRLFSGDLDRADGLSALGLRKVLASIPEGITSKVLRVARTVADLDGVEEVTAAHVEAAYRLRGMP